MKRLILMTLTACTLFAGMASAQDGDRSDGFDRRESNQKERIRDGWREGDLTRGERRHLVRSQRQIDRVHDRFERDGRLSPRERGRLERLQDRNSRRIYRLRHNRRSC